MALVERVPQEACHPVDPPLDGAWEVRGARYALRARHHQHVGEAVRQDAEQRGRTVAPLVAQGLPLGALDVEVIEGAGDGVEARREDDQIQLVVRCRRLDAGLRDALDRRLGEAHEVHVVAVVGLEVAGFQWQALEAEAVVLRDQLLGDLRILHALPDATGDVLGHLPVGRFVGEDLHEVALQDGEARRRVKLVPEGDPFLVRQIPEAAPGEAAQFAKISS
jgi:hypothetical protein